MAEGVSRARIEAEPEEWFTSLRRPLGVTAFGINQIVLRPGQRNRVHRHREQEEVYVVLDGRLNLVLEDGEELVLERGEIARVAPEPRRQLLNRGPERLVLLALGGAGEHHSRDAEAYPDWDVPIDEGAKPGDVPLPPNLPVD